MEACFHSSVPAAKNAHVLQTDKNPASLITILIAQILVSVNRMNRDSTMRWALFNYSRVKGYSSTC